MSDSTPTTRVPSERPSGKPPSEARVLELERTIGYLGRANPDPVVLVRLLRELVEATRANTELGARARLVLATKLLSGDPRLGPVSAERAWLCAGLCREARLGPLHAAERALTYALGGVAFSALECFKAAAQAYYQSLREVPDDPVVAHNLGHLLHVRLGRPVAALRWLRQAHHQLASEPEVAASYAYALVATGDLEAAVDVLAPALGSRALARTEIARWC